MDSIKWIENKGKSITLMHDECIRDMDLFKEGTDFSVPIYFFLGRYDLLTEPEGAVALFNKITAPQKKIIWFDCAHEIMWEKTLEYQKKLIEIFTTL